jgi:uncharacterized Zn-finger protein
VHQRRHIGERAYTCCVCNKSFKEQDSMNLHKRIHWRKSTYL